MTKQKQSNSLFFNACFDKGQLKNLIAWFLENYGEKLTVDFLETLKQIGFHQATLAGVSLGLDDLQIPLQKSILISQALSDIQVLTQNNAAGNVTSVEKSQRMIDTWNQTSEILRQTAVQHFRNTNPVNPVYMMAFSGARGNISQVRQLVAMRGLMADPQGAILEFPIQSNFREGLTITEYLISCYGARKGLVDTALRTATSGYLTRRLVDAVQHVVITMTNCGTTKGVLLKGKNLESRLIGRVLAKNLTLYPTPKDLVQSNDILKKNQVISPTLAKTINSHFTEILVRSPLTCEAEKSVCQMCYGWNLAHGKLVSIGEAVGVIAAQSIGEPGTQLTMRTFHTGGVGVFSDQATKLFTAPFSGKIEFTEEVPGLFVRTPHGNIVYMLKYTSSNANRKFLKLKSSDLGQDNYFITEQELPAGSILWVKQGEYVKSGQLVAQSSQIKTSKQQMPESTHPVQSPLDGEIYFESMVIVKQKQLPIKTKKRKPKEDEIGPNIRSLIKLGSFWVFSAYTQREFHIAKSFLRAGDLVSPTTPLFQYNFHTIQKGQLKKNNSEVFLGQNYFNFGALEVRYSKFTYILNRVSKNQGMVLYRKSCKRFSNKYSLFWYPSWFISKTPGYFCTLINYFETYLPDNFLRNSNSVSYDLKNLRGNIFCLPQPLLNWNTAFATNLKFKQEYLNTIFILNKNKKCLSTTGLLQAKTISNIPFTKQKYFYFDIRKNTKKTYQSPITPFLIFGLKQAQMESRASSSTSLLQKKQGWSYIPNLLTKNRIENNLELKPIVLESGKKFDQLIFSNSPVSLSFINFKSFQIFDSTKPLNSQNLWYESKSLLNSEKNTFLGLKSKLAVLFLPVKKTNSNSKLKTRNFGSRLSNNFNFVFYQIKKEDSGDLFFTGKKRSIFNIFFKVKKQKKIPGFILIQNLIDYYLPNKKVLIKNWFSEKICLEAVRVQSPLITKQIISSKSYTKLTPLLEFKINLLTNSNWFSAKPLIRVQVQLNVQSNSIFKRVLTNFKYWNPYFQFNIPSKGISLFCYDSLYLRNIAHFYIQTFSNNWVLPKRKITTGFVQLNKAGEFRRLKITQNESIVSIIRTQDLKTFTIPFGKETLSFKKNQIGSLVRWGQEITPEFGSALSGQVLKLTCDSLTLRLGVPILASARGIVHVFHNDLVQKDDLLITLKSRRLQTEDIVQGIPKIEQLFEARETQGGEIITNSVHTKLQNFFLDSLQTKGLDLAVPESVKNIQAFLVENILEAYANQGVKISEKHVEIVVRQMTTRVRILTGGDTGLLPGELVQFTWISELNKQLRNLGYREAAYEPIVLGITKSVLQSESFLLAASFQEVSRVLVRSALSKKTDFLRGLHENVILGQLVPAGTGLLSHGLSEFKVSRASKLKLNE